MRYLIALICPPLAVFLCGKPFQAILNAIIWVSSVVLIFVGIGLLFVWMPMLHAIMVVNARLADSRNSALIAAMKSR